MQRHQCLTLLYRSEASSLPRSRSTLTKANLEPLAVMQVAPKIRVRNPLVGTKGLTVTMVVAILLQAVKLKLIRDTVLEVTSLKSRLSSQLLVIRSRKVMRSSTCYNYSWLTKTKTKVTLTTC